MFSSYNSEHAVLTEVNHNVVAAVAHVMDCRPVVFSRRRAAWGGAERCQAQASRSGGWDQWNGVGCGPALAAARQDAQPFERDQERCLWQVADCLGAQLSPRV